MRVCFLSIVLISFSSDGMDKPYKDPSDNELRTTIRNLLDTHQNPSNPRLCFGASALAWIIDKDEFSDLVREILSNKTVLPCQPGKHQCLFEVTINHGASKNLELFLGYLHDNDSTYCEKLVNDKLSHREDTPLQWAAINGDWRMLDVLVRFRADPTAADKHGYTSLHNVVVNIRKKPLLDLQRSAAVLCEWGANGAAKNNCGKTPSELVAHLQEKAKTKQKAAPHLYTEITDFINQLAHAKKENIADFNRLQKTLFYFETDPTFRRQTLFEVLPRELLALLQSTYAFYVLNNQ